MSNSNSSQLANIALLYYKEGLTQGEIAARIGVSRATVVNYLRLARDHGIVDIRVQGASFTASSLSKDVKERFGLQDVYIAENALLPVAARRTPSATTVSPTIRIAAAALVDFVLPGSVLGVAWGETIHQLANEAPRHSIANLTVCQMTGSMESPRLPTAEDCAIRIASRLGAKCHTLHAPAILSTVELADALRKEPTIRSQLNRLSQLDQCVFSVGHCEPDTHIVQSGIASKRQASWYRKQGAVGVLCSRFIDANGTPIEGEVDTRMIGVTLNQLRTCSSGLLVASGQDRIEAIRAVLLGGYATHLVTDEVAAMGLLGFHEAQATCQ